MPLKCYIKVRSHNLYKRVHVYSSHESRGAAAAHNYQSNESCSLYIIRYIDTSATSLHQYAQTTSITSSSVFSVTSNTRKGNKSQGTRHQLQKDTGIRLLVYGCTEHTSYMFYCSFDDAKHSYYVHQNRNFVFQRTNEKGNSVLDTRPRYITQDPSKYPFVPCVGFVHNKIITFYT